LPVSGRQRKTTSPFSRLNGCTPALLLTIVSASISPQLPLAKGAKGDFIAYRMAQNTIEVVSQPRITPEGKAQADSKAQSACGG
jgi:hypothetical protein